MKRIASAFARAKRGRTSGRTADLQRAVVEGLEPRKMLSVNVTSWHNDAGLTGLNPNEQVLTPANVTPSSFGALFSYPVTGQVYAQPLYVSNLNIPGKGTFNVVFVATQNNDVYAFNANSNSGPTGGLIWHVNLGPAAAMPNVYFGNRYGSYHDINPQVGITSTPVIDLASGTMYVDSFTNDVVGQNVYSNHIHALDITSGQDKITPVAVAAAVAGNGVGGNGTTVSFAAEQQLQRPALTLLNGTLYAGFGAFADSDPYHGWILGFNPATLQLQSVFNDTPNLLSAPAGDTAGEGGIWQSGAGLASDGSNLFLMVGNGDFNASLGDFGDSVLKLTTDSTTPAAPGVNGYGVHVADYFTPYNQLQLSNADEDLGSGGGIVLPDQPGAYPHEYIGAGKQGLIYVINRDNMGQTHLSTDSVIQTVNLGHGVFDSPAYFNSAIYYHAVGDVLKKYIITNGLLSAAPAAQAITAYNSQGATPSISSNGTANGIVWEVQWDAAHEVLHAYDAGNLAELFNSNQNPPRDQLGAGVKFIVPTVADGEVFVGSSNSVTVFGLTAPPTTAPLAPTSLLAVAGSASSVSLTWVDNSNNESGFKIFRSTDGVTFTQIAIANANATLFTDSTVAPNTKYVYQICATNVIGDSAFTTPTPVTTPNNTNAADLYHFDEGAGTTTIDSANGNNGTLTGATLPQWVTPGHAGGSALSFTGDGTFNQTASESAVQLSSDLSPILGSTSTLDAWIKTTQVGSPTHWMSPAITGVEQYGAGNDINWGTLDDNGRVGIFVGDSGGIYSTNPINDGQWHNVAMTRDAVTGVVQIYVDGVLNASATLEAGNKTSLFSTLGALTVVGPDGVTRTGANYFNGQIDELRIYNSVLGLNEVDSMSLVPTAPSLQSISAAAGPVIHLTFSSPSAFARTLEIDRTTGSSGVYTAIATVPAGALMYDDVNVTAGTAYSYIIKAIDVAGTSPASNALSITPPVPTIVANSIFYNNSKFDGNNGSSNLTDDNAVATDKTALLPGGTAGFANISSYSKGINGIIIDVANLVYLPRIDDFMFRVGNDNTPANWATAPSPTYVNNYPGRGPGGSTQITIIWDDNAIQNEWLQVTVLAQPHLDLPADDVFYFGSAIGDTGADSTSAIVTAADVTRVNNAISASANVINPFDINRDGAVNAVDASIVTANQTTRLTALNLIALTGNAPAKPTGLTATAGAGSVTLSWTAAANATGYNIYRGTSANGEGATPIVTGLAGTTYIDTTGLTSGSTYYYFVTATSPEGAPSNETSAAPLPIAPVKPSGVSATAGISSITLTWNPSANAVSYNVYRGTATGAETATPIATGITGTLFIDSSVSSTTKYFYYVTALSPESAPSVEVSATPLPTAPAKPTGVTATAGTGSIALKWNASTNAISYNIYRGTAAGGESATPLVTGIVGTSYVDSSVVASGTYFYYVTALSPESAASTEVSATPIASVPLYKLSGAVIGTPTSWANSGDTTAQAFDGNLSTAFDAPNSSLTNWVGLDLGSPQTIAQIKFAPRAGYEFRMYGAQFQASSTADFSSGVVTFYTVNAIPVAGQLTTVAVNPGAAYRYVRYVGGTQWVNVAELEFDGPSPMVPTAVKIPGTAIGTQTSYLNSGDTINQVFDGNLSTFFDAPNSSLTAWVGLDMGGPQTITQIKFAPRSGYGYRLYGGQFQVSSTVDFSSNVKTIYTISSIPTSGVLTAVSVSPGAAYRYIRYIGGTQWVNIAEMEVDGIYTAPPVSAKLTGTAIGTAPSILTANTSLAQAFDGNLTTYFSAPDNSLTDWVGLDLGSARTITQIKFAPRSGYAARMVGGQFQVSSTANFSSNVVTIYTVATAPTTGVLTSISVSVPGPFRYVRYVGGTTHVDIAEMEVDGY